MGSCSVQLTPLSGAHSESPLCYMLQVDGFRFLLDCGWTDSFDVSQLQPLASVASTIDAVLLSYPDTMHLGALPYAVGKLGLTATVYCTLPVHRMGQMYMYDHYLSRRAVSNFDTFNLDDVDTAFHPINSVQLKYSQHFPLQGKGEGIIITPYAAGHLLGGTVWKITVDAEDIIYAVDYNHRKERHLNGTVLETFVRPSVLITDSYNALNNQPSRRKRDVEFLGETPKLARDHGHVRIVGLSSYQSEEDPYIEVDDKSPTQLNPVSDQPTPFRGPTHHQTLSPTSYCSWAPWFALTNILKL